MRRKRPRGRFDDGGPVRQVDSSIPPITPGPNPQVYQPQTQSEASQIMGGISTGLKLATALGGSDSSKRKGGKITKVVRPVVKAKARSKRR